VPGLSIFQLIENVGAPLFILCTLGEGDGFESVTLIEVTRLGTALKRVKVDCAGETLKCDLEQGTADSGSRVAGSDIQVLNPSGSRSHGVADKANDPTVGLRDVGGSGHHDHLAHPPSYILVIMHQGRVRDVGFSTSQKDRSDLICIGRSCHAKFHFLA
jgi:hypothetical protein